MDISTKYRPKALDEVIGHKKVIKSLKEILLDRTLLPHAYLFVGPSGVGKTSIARILARELGCKPYNLIEQDSVTNSSIDYYRELLVSMRYPALGNSPYRVLILDEAQSISKPIWQAMISDIEEPLAHEFFILCTTDISKLPDILLTRMNIFKLLPLNKGDILQQLYKIKIAENFSISDEELEWITDNSKGSMRQAISLLSSSRQEGSISHYLNNPLDDLSPQLLDFCKKIIYDKPPTIKEFFEFDGETLRSALIMYTTHSYFMKNPSQNLIKWSTLMYALMEPLKNGMPELVFRLCLVVPELFSELNRFPNTNES